MPCGRFMPSLNAMWLKCSFNLGATWCGLDAGVHVGLDAT